jgi:tRNA-dihydrouridine synthase
MEGVVDFVIRDVYSDLGGVDRFVTEFIRATKHLHPKIIFHRYAPELHVQSLSFSSDQRLSAALGHRKNSESS